jgi:LPXTG-motif cell wall-anchored protein
MRSWGGLWGTKFPHPGPQDQTEVAGTKLPHTGSMAGDAAALGVGALAAGAAMRAVHKRRRAQADGPTED